MTEELRGLDLAIATLAAIKNNPQHWDQATWRCSTGMCFAGWAISIAAPELWKMPTPEEFTEPRPSVSGNDERDFTAEAEWWGKKRESEAANWRLINNQDIEDTVTHMLGVDVSRAVKVYNDDGSLAFHEGLFSEFNGYDALVDGVAEVFGVSRDEVTSKVEAYQDDWELHLKRAGLKQ